MGLLESILTQRAKFRALGAKLIGSWSKFEGYVKLRGKGAKLVALGTKYGILGAWLWDLGNKFWN